MMSVTVIAVICAIAAPICGLIGTWYGTRRTAQAQEREAKRRSDAAMAQIEKVDAVEQAHKALVGTIREMREELKRQDEEHAKAIGALEAKLDVLRRVHQQCEEDRDTLQARIRELERG